MPINPASMPGQTRRFAAAALIVVAVGVSLWLFGRAEPQSSVAVVAAAEDWPAGREPGGFTIVEMPAESAALFVTVEQLIGRVPAVPVPAGTIVSASLLTDSSLPTASKLSATLLAVAVETALWPEWSKPNRNWPHCWGRWFGGSGSRRQRAGQHARQGS